MHFFAVYGPHAQHDTLEEEHRRMLASLQEHLAAMYTAFASKISRARSGGFQCVRPEQHPTGARAARKKRAGGARAALDRSDEEHNGCERMRSHATRVRQFRQ